MFLLSEVPGLVPLWLVTLHLTPVKAVQEALPFVVVLSTLVSEMAVLQVLLLVQLVVIQMDWEFVSSTH